MSPPQENVQINVTEISRETEQNIWWQTTQVSTATEIESINLFGVQRQILSCSLFFVLDFSIMTNCKMKMRGAALLFNSDSQSLILEALENSRTIPFFFSFGKLQPPQQHLLIEVFFLTSACQDYKLLFFFILYLT